MPAQDIQTLTLQVLGAFLKTSLLTKKTNAAVKIVTMATKICDGTPIQTITDATMLNMIYAAL